MPHPKLATGVLVAAISLASATSAIVPSQAEARTRHCPSYGQAYDITAKSVSCKTARIVYRTMRRSGDAIELGFRCSVQAPRTRPLHLRYTCKKGKRSVGFSVRGGKTF
ncbi:MAG: hypothetical protein WC558_08200 [Patulibacter sp.]